MKQNVPAQRNKIKKYVLNIFKVKRQSLFFIDSLLHIQEQKLYAIPYLSSDSTSCVALK